MPPTNERESIADPRALYDRESNRFFLISGASTENAPPCTPERCFSHFLLAVSKDSAPKTLTDADWYLYALPMTREFPPHTVQLIDFPSLSVSGGFVGRPPQMIALLRGATPAKPYQQVGLI